MSIINVNGVELFYELSGANGIPIVLVHGSWVSHQNWSLVVPHLSESFQVLAYDRRGHSESQRPAGQGSVREDVADLAALIERLELTPAWVVGNSFGASIALRLAGERPELFRGLIAHEPPLFALLEDDPAVAPLLRKVGGEIETVAQRIAAGDHAGAAEQFVETVAFGPGAWATLPPQVQQVMMANAPTFLDEAGDPEGLVFDLSWIQAFRRPCLFTGGGQSPKAFAAVLGKLAGALPNAEVVRFAGAGHIPHVSHPDDYVQAIMAFVLKNSS